MANNYRLAQCCKHCKSRDFEMKEDVWDIRFYCDYTRKSYVDNTAVCDLFMFDDTKEDMKIYGGTISFG